MRQGEVGGGVGGREPSASRSKITHSALPHVLDRNDQFPTQAQTVISAAICGTCTR